MKLKNFWKRFCTFDRHSAAGFTLVELIVVIAILAILAGVAIPVYSGYIKKAERAADEQLLAAVNTAFAAACLQNGANHFALTAEPTITLVAGTDGKKVGSVSVYNDAFMTFFAGNENSEFKVIQALYYNSEIGGFAEDGVVKYAYGDGYVYISASDAQKLANSTFGDIGSAELLSKLDKATELASGLSGSNAYLSVLKSTEFQNSAADALNTDVANLNGEVERLAQQIVDNSNGTIDLDTAKTQVTSNAIVLFAAQSSVGMTADDAVGLLTGENFADTITTNLAAGGDTTVAMSNAALAYGMYTAYANSSYAKDPVSTNDVSAVMGDLSNPDFIAYMNSAQGKTDAQAYLSALNMINSSTEDPAAVENLMVNGFDDPALAALLNQTIGK